MLYSKRRRKHNVYIHKIVALQVWLKNYKVLHRITLLILRIVLSKSFLVILSLSASWFVKCQYIDFISYIMVRIVRQVTFKN
jgi:hypothetical protein